MHKLFRIVLPVLIVAASVAVVSAHDDVDVRYRAEHDRPHLSVESLREDPSNFAGVWTGQWDWTWDVGFEIAEPDAEGRCEVIYRWRENTEDEELTERRLNARYRDGKIETGRITIEYKGPHSLVAIGRFGKYTRVAVLDCEDFSGAEVGHAEHDDHHHDHGH